MKKLIVALAVCGAVFTAAAQNLLLNPEFAGTSTNLGPWNKNSAVYNNEVTRLPGAGPDGKTAIKIDLASCPGMDAPDVIWARGLPGKDAPETSGELIARTILRLLYNKERS